MQVITAATGNIVAGCNRCLAGMIDVSTSVCDQARQDAFDPMLDRAQRLGANAMIGVRLVATEFAEELTAVLANGTTGPLHNLQAAADKIRSEPW